MEPGCSLSLLLHVAFQGLFALSIGPFYDWAYASGFFERGEDSGSGLEILMVPGFFFLTQLLYMLPAAFIARRSGRHHLARNLVFQAGVLFLLGGTCTGLLALQA